jgi:hypothetical protein
VNLLGAVFDDYHEGPRKTENAADYEIRKRDFVFHMTDWLDDLKELTALYDHPDRADVPKACISLIGILYHVIPHLNAAGRLFLGNIPDPFAGPQAKPKAEPKQTPPKGKSRRKARPKAS